MRPQTLNNRQNNWINFATFSPISDPVVSMMADAIRFLTLLLDGPPISLSDILTTQTITPLLNDPEICASLFPFLPEESERSVEEVRQVVRSPQFSQALQSLSAALQTGQLGPLLTQLGLDPSAGNSVESFLIAISEQAKKKKGDAMED
ncbi:uncharacterized protein B0P05DRAFT_368649 [Gilbertella persicaria]|uniref:uncharacterized protein n=1 Tax=Gilbertella persicaria TaxID=101096 RepID=UPI00221FCDD0|nr:uncharacterized protein B0P05DRAFT_368649 [Gilbertella persicaria]KAI8087614.1 hypothetical protein B0P05DRAFT_368649 [Gilbertella persicaria]